MTPGHRNEEQNWCGGCGGKDPTKKESNEMWKCWVNYDHNLDNISKNYRGNMGDDNAAESMEADRTSKEYSDIIIESIEVD
jgi:hypothetical protein